MKILHLVQGSPEWHAHRAAHWNASDAPAMLGVSPHKKRSELLRELHSGVAREFSDYVQERVIDPGHEYEARARTIAERIIGEELYPCTGSEGRYSASFDGLTLLGDVAFEHKTLNDELRAVLTEGTNRDGSEFAINRPSSLLPEHYRVQMEHQCLVSGATRVLFMASKWDAGELNEERHCWYYPDPELRARIVAGWEQFERDLAAYQPGPDTGPATVGRAPEQLPALRIELIGSVTASNLDAFRDHAIEVFRGIRTDLHSDQDFADAEKTVKWCGEIEERLDAAKAHALSQTATIDELFRTIDSIKAEARAKRLELNNLVTKRKEQIRAEIVTQACDSVRAHYTSINATLGEHAIYAPQSLQLTIAAAIKGKKTLSSIRDAADTTAAAEKIAGSQRAERVRASIAALAEVSAGHESLFPDRVSLCVEKAPDDIRNLAAARIAEHERRQAAAEAQRQHIEQLDRAAAAEKIQEPVAQQVEQLPSKQTVAGSIPAGLSTARIKLGDINARIAPLTITADGLAQLGFASVGTERAAKLYRESDFPAICSKLVSVIQNAAAERRAA